MSVEFPTLLLRPAFTLVGSVAEGTKVGLGNELDIMVDFRGWSESDPLFTINPEDPFHLYASETCPAWMSPYFDGMGRFNQQKFKTHFIRAIDRAVRAIFRSGLNPPCLGECIPNSRGVSCRKGLNMNSRINRIWDGFDRILGPYSNRYYWS